MAKKTKNTNNTTTVTVNSALVNAILANRGFKSRKVEAEQISNNESTLKQYHAILDDLLRISYNCFADSYNRKEVNTENTNKLYAKVRELFALLGELENGVTLKADADTATVLTSLSCKESTIYSAKMQYLRSCVSNDKKAIAKMLSENGTVMNGMEGAYAMAKARIEETEKQIEEEKLVENAVKRSFTRVKADAWYKALENYLADVISNALIKTSEEIEAEEKARKEARNKKNNAKKRAKKEAEKNANTEETESEGTTEETTVA